MATLTLLLVVLTCALFVQAYRPKFVSKIKTKDYSIDKRPMVSKHQQFLALMRNLPQEYYARGVKRGEIEDYEEVEKRAGRNANRQNQMLTWMRNVPMKRFGSAGLFDPNRYQNAFSTYELPVEEN
uniref:Uncharacterized protein n=1 Tax=Plectus sambesii TaxID=2011161 RepID=A0A914VQ48_9BILA